MTEIKPCPFCGSGNVHLVTSTQAAMSWVACRSCGLEAPTETGVSAEDAVRYWETRTPDPSVITGLREARNSLNAAAEYMQSRATECSQPFPLDRCVATLAHLDTLLANQEDKS